MRCLVGLLATLCDLYFLDSLHLLNFQRVFHEIALAMGKGSCGLSIANGAALVTGGSNYLFGTRIFMPLASTVCFFSCVHIHVQ